MQNCRQFAFYYPVHVYTFLFFQTFLPFVYLNNISGILFHFQISAQESRRKKKEFVDTLEQRVSLASAEVDAYKKRCELLQKQNASLMTQLNNLRAMLVNQSSCGNIISTSKTISSTTLSALSTFILVTPNISVSIFQKFYSL